MKYTLKHLLIGFSLCLLLGTGLAQNYGGVLRAGMQTDPVGLDPHTTQATATRNMLENTYDTLVKLNASLEVEPNLATSWESSEDGLTWTFHLREGVTFHNGDPLQASDVVFSINRIRDPEIASPNAGDFAVLETIEATDENTVVMTLSEPFSPLLSKLAFSLNAIVSEKVAMAHDNDLNSDQAIVGTGPFVFEEYIPQTRLVLSRNANYWETDADGNALPYLDGVTFTFYPEGAARTTAVQTNNVDWIEYVPAPDVEILQFDPNVEVVGGLATNFRSIYINTAEGALADPLVRRAMAYAVDEQAVVDVALFGTGGVPADGTTLPTSAFYGLDEASPYVGRDVDKAKELLAASDYSDGFEFDMYVTSTYDFLRTPAEIIQANLAEIGITMNIVAEDWSIYLPKVLDYDFQATLLGNSGLADPDDYLYNVFHTDGTGNYVNYSNSELDALLTQGRQASDPEERKAIYAQAQAIILEDSPHIFLFHSAQYEAHRTNVKGFQHYPNTGYLSFRTTWFE